MNCHDIENRISAYLDNELSSDDRKQFEAHLTGCKACDLFADEMKQVDTLLLESTPPLPDEAYWAGFDAKLKEKVDKIPAKRPWWNFGHIFRKQLHWAALAALVLMAVVFPVLRDFVSPTPSMRQEVAKAPATSAASAPEKQAAPADDGMRAKAEAKPGDENISSEAASGGTVPEQPPVVHAPAPGSSEADAVFETEGGAPATQPEESLKKSNIPMRSADKQSSGSLKADTFGTKDAETKSERIPKAEEKTAYAPAPAKAEAPAEPAAPPPAMAKAPAPVAAPPATEMAPPTGRVSKENKSTVGISGSAKGKAAAPGSVDMKADKYYGDQDVPIECAPDSRLYDPKTEEARKVAQVPEVNDYLAASEAVLIRIITLPEDGKKLKMLQEDLNMAKFRDTVNKTSDKVKNVKVINTHTKTMQTITDEVLNINPSQIKDLKRKVIDSGIIDKTRELKQ
ncbi:MAG: zf-HC2 domain-containing protein [Firmicutes bacterium]|nr:zf-HC2 domain-containing protein [Bacillota bacterium]